MLFKKGFTLLEVLIAIAVLILMTSVLFLRQDGNKAKSEVEAAARQVASQLRSLQNDALNGKIVNEGSNNYAICRTGMRIESDGYMSFYERDCASGGTEIGLSSKKELKKVGFSATGDITFESPTGVVSASTITLISARDNNIRAVVCISDSGNIEEAFGSTCP